MPPKIKKDKRFLLTILVLVVLPVIVLILSRTTFFKPQAGSTESPLAFLEQSVKSAKYIGTTNDKELSSFDKVLIPKDLPDTDSSALDQASPTSEQPQELQQEAGTGDDGGNKNYGREIIPSVLGTVSGYTGSAGFSLPISTPPGPGGVGPNIALSYSSGTLDDSRLGNEYFRNPEYYPVSYTPAGFGLSGFASIIRDTRKYPEAPTLEGDAYHRFLVTLPTGEAFQLKYNEENGHWLTIPNSFVKVEHYRPGEPANNQPFADVTSQGGLDYVDAGQFIITTRDGTAYYFGEENLPSKLDGDGKIKDSQPLEEETWHGSQGGNIYNEFYRSYKCEGDDNETPCRKGTPPNDDATHDGKRKLFVKKWLLQKVLTASGQEINYTYDVHQRYDDYGSGGPHYLTTTAYPQAVTWNEGKFAVEFDKELTPDPHSKEEHIRYRVSNINVKIKDPGANQLNTVRSYKLNYFENSEEGCLKDKPPRLSFLKSVQEFGYDSTTSTPPVSFCYTTLNVGGSNDFFGLPLKYNPAVYLSQINNGYGGVTKFEYETTPVTYYNKTGETDLTEKGWWGSKRARIIKKTVVDSTENKSFTEEYSYGTPLGYSEELGRREGVEGSRDHYTGLHPPTGMQFLGYSFVEVTSKDFDGSVLSHTRDEFHQANQSQYSCFEPHPAKGQAHTSIVYNGNTPAVETINDYRYRLDGVADKPVSQGCDPERIDQPLFVYLRRTDTISTDGDTAGFIESDKTELNEVKGALKTQIRTATENITFDEYGFITQSAILGEVNLDGSESPEQKADNRYTYKHNIYNINNWMLGYPYLTYTSTSQFCSKGNKTGPEEPDQNKVGTVCEYGRTETLYDNNTDFEQQELSNGFVTEIRSYLDTNLTQLAVQTFKPDQYGNVWEIRSSKPNEETTAGTAGRWDLQLEANNTYDTYYHTLLLTSANALGHQTIYENYHPQLLIPQRIKVQTNLKGVSPGEKYAVTEFSYDALGRTIATYLPNPENPEKIMSSPATYNHYFQEEGQPLKSRTMAWVSILNNQDTYQTTDKLYDSLGNAIQTQLLQTKVNGEEQRLVSNYQFNAAGQTEEVYDIQTASAVIIPELKGSDGDTQTIRTSPPTLAQVSNTVVGNTTYDALGRAVQSTQRIINGDSFTTNTSYLANATKLIDPTGSVAITVADSWGRTLYELGADKNWENIILKKYTYEKTMVDAPTKTIIFSPNSPDRTEITAQYDDAGRVLTTYDPSLGEYKYTYDIRSNTKNITRSGGSVVEMTYDALNRVTTKTYKTTKNLFALDLGIGKGKVTEYKYDQGQYALGKAVQITDPTGLESYSYDKAQRLIEKRKTIKDKTQSFKSTYNRASQLTVQTNPDAKVYFYYDREGRSSEIKLNDKEPLVNYNSAVYDKYGNLVTSKVMGDYVDTSYYDNLGRLEELKVTNSQGTQLGQELIYNQVGDIVGIAETLGGKSENLSFTYDSFSRLKTARSGEQLIGAYDYDIFGRMTKKTEGNTTTTMQFDAIYPFFAPKSAKIDSQNSLFQVGEGLVAQEKPVEQLEGPSAAELRNPFFGSTPQTRKYTSPTTKTPTTKIEDTGKLIGLVEFTPTYTNQGALTEDHEACYEYNDLNQLITISIKKNAEDKCPLNNNQIEKKILFYYDHAGTLVLQEEYDPRNMKSPLKQTFLFGSYEEVYEK